MMKIICLALFVTLASASGPLGVVTPVEPCGGAGTPVQLRIENCQGAPPCDIAPNTPTLVEGDFIPSADSDLANFRLVAQLGGTTIPISDGPLGALTGGTPYTASQSIQVSNAQSGQTLTVTLDVYDVASGRIEICVRAPMRVI